MHLVGKHVLLDRLGEIGDARELGRIFDHVVGELRKHLRLGFLDLHRERDVLSTLVGVPVRQRGLAADRRADLGAFHDLVESRDERLGAELIHQVLRRRRFDLVAVLRHGDVDHRKIAVGEGAVVVGQLGKLIAQRIELLVNLVLGYSRILDLDFEVTEVRK